MSSINRYIQAFNFFENCFVNLTIVVCVLEDLRIDHRTFKTFRSFTRIRIKIWVSINISVMFQPYATMFSKFKNKNANQAHLHNFKVQVWIKHSSYGTKDKVCSKYKYYIVNEICQNSKPLHKWQFQKQWPQNSRTLSPTSTVTDTSNHSI